MAAGSAPLFQLEGYKDYVKSLKDLPPELKKELSAVIAETVGTVRDMAVAGIPHHGTSRYANGSRGGTARQPGGMEAGIKASRSGVYGQVQSTAAYARIVEFGSHVTRPTSRGNGSVSYVLGALGEVPKPQKGRDLLAAGWEARERYGPELTARVMRLMERAFEVERGG